MSWKMVGIGSKEVGRMCGASLARRGAGLGSIEARGDRGGSNVWGPALRRTEFFGLEVEEMGPRVRVVTGLAVLVLVLLSGLMLVAFVPGLWWVFTTYGWVSFPAFGLVVSGVAGLSEGRAGSRPAESGERELLEALRERGELTPTRAAMETSLSVAEADRMLRELAENGHLEVRVRGGALYYALWARPATLEAGAHRGEDSSG
jgi:hypothetical protein